MERLGVEPVRVGVFDQEVAVVYGEEDGLPDLQVRDIVVTDKGTVFAATDGGLVQFDGERWRRVQGVPAGRIGALAFDGEGVYGLVSERLFKCQGQAVSELSSAAPVAATSLVVGDGVVWIASPVGLTRFEGGRMHLERGLQVLLDEQTAIRQVAVGPAGRVAVAAAKGLFLRCEDKWARLLPKAGRYSWAVHDARGVAFDRSGRLWFCCPQGVGVLDGEGAWRLFTGREGLPHNDFTTAASGEEGVVWFGTRLGAIRYDGEELAYRQGRRWLPDDGARAIAVDAKGNAWFATSGGVGVIERRPMTLAKKAEYFEKVIDARHRRTFCGFVNHCGLAAPGDIQSPVTKHDSDNEGLWTGMYGAGECFAYGATKDPKAKARAKAAFEALKFLCDVTQGGEKEVMRGFPARSILPTSGRNPNESYTAEKDRQRRNTSDPFWKVMHPRWPKSADGTWYWKCDTSSDELDGHYFMNALYHDLVAETPEEKDRVAKVICDTTDHLMANDYGLVDWDGERTRWAYFGPHDINKNPACWEERGMNSLGILAYLAIAEHVSGDAKYRRARHALAYDHDYAMNFFMSTKMHEGPGTGNQSDDEMTIMRFYSLIKYETDPQIRQMARWAFWRYWRLVRRERNPFFNFLYAASYAPGTGMFTQYDYQPKGKWLEHGVEMLKGQPLCLVNWRLRNSHRLDILPHFQHGFHSDGRPTHGFLRDGGVLPIENRYIEHWSADVWRLDQGGDGRTESDGAYWLLAYYAGKYFGFIAD